MKEMLSKGLHLMSRGWDFTDYTVPDLSWRTSDPSSCLDSQPSNKLLNPAQGPRRASAGPGCLKGQMKLLLVLFIHIISIKAAASSSLKAASCSDVCVLWDMQTSIFSHLLIAPPISFPQSNNRRLCSVSSTGTHPAAEDTEDKQVLALWNLSLLVFLFQTGLERLEWADQTRR